MENFFQKNPVKVLSWSKTASGDWNHKTYVFINIVDQETRRALDAASRDPKRESAILKRVYGPEWRVRLGFEHRSKKTRGGDALEMEIDMPIDIPAEETVTVASAETAVITDEPEKIEIIQTVNDEINITDIADAAVKHADIGRSPKKAASSGHQFVYDMSVWPEDKVSELKLKINYSINIPVFRQHIWYEHNEQKVPLRYVFTQSGSAVAVDMPRVIAGETQNEIVFDMPVDMFLYRNKETLKVEAYDNFTLLGNIYARTGVSVFNVVDLETFIAPHRDALGSLEKHDKYQMQIIYYGFVMIFYPMLNISAFGEYIDSKTIHESYPQLEPSRDELEYLVKQNALVSELYTMYTGDHYRVEKIDRVLHKSLTETTLKVISQYRGKTINLRVLFDLFPLSDEVDAMRLYDVYEGRHIQIDKYRDDAPPPAEKLIPGVLYFRVVVSERPRQRLNLFLYPNGAYAIRGVWGEDKNYEFKDVNKIVDHHVNPIIKQINDLAAKAMYRGEATRLDRIEKSNVKFIDISISLFWKKILTSAEFRQLKLVLDQFVAAHVIVEKQIDRTVLSYFFRRGMFEFDPKRIEKTAALDNYYAYMFNSDIRQKWHMLFDQVRVMTITHRFSDVKIEISGIKEDEYYIFIRYIVLLMSRFMRQRQDEKPGAAVVDERAAKPLSNLKEQDPHLYNFKKIYNSDVIYSKICQKPYQPNLLTQTQYDALSKVDKAKIVKYWNFTTKTDAYYRCPSAKYQHVRFITNKHPMGFCIPCCKIQAPPRNPNDKQRQIYDQCLHEHHYEKREVERSLSRYVMSYGKPIDVGRLSNLPENTLEPLLYDTGAGESADSKASEEETLVNAKYYLYGVEQNHPNVAHVGLLYCIAHALSMNLQAFVELVADRVEERRARFPLLLNGSISRWFATTTTMIATLRQIFSQSTTKSITPVSDIDWNVLFIDIALHFLDIYVIIFEDRDTVISLVVPQYLDNIEDMQYPTHKHLVVLHNHGTNHWNPVYVLHKELYFRAGIVDRKLYGYDSDIVHLIMDMVISRTKERSGHSHLFKLSVLKKYIAASRGKYKISKILIARENLCYGALVVDGRSANKIIGFVPVHLSPFKFDSEIGIGFHAVDIKPGSLENIIQFIERYNSWVATESERNGYIKLDIPLSRPLIERVEPMYAIIDPERWIVYKSAIIALSANGLSFYVTETRITHPAVISARLPLQRILYDPLAINVVLERGESESPVADERSKTIDFALYKNYAYQLLVLEFIQMFNNQRNDKVRTALRAFVSRLNTKNSDGKEIAVSIRDIISRGVETVVDTDVEKLATQISEYIASSGARQQLFDIIDREFYAFDMVGLERLKKLPKHQTIEHLQRLARDIVTVGTVNPRSLQFPNILESCHGNRDAPKYCARNRLIMSRSDLDRYLKILADQIKNPFIERYLFSPLFQSSLIDYFKFTQREGEIIEIEFL